MNEINTLERCLKSLLNQSFKDIGIIIQNNYSDDGSEKIIMSFQSMHPNVFFYNTNCRIDQWKNWDVLFNNAIENFHFDYLFWIGGDDYVLENDFFQSLYEKAVKENLNVVTPVINIIDGQTGELKERFHIELNSKFKLNRILQFSINWTNVNLTHSLIARNLYTEILNISGGSHTNYMGNDWWRCVTIVRLYKIESYEVCNFFKSQWNKTRYSWTSDTDQKHRLVFSNRIFNFLQHLFRDSTLILSHLYGNHPLRDRLSYGEKSVIWIVFMFKAITNPFYYFAKSLNRKFKLITADLNISRLFHNDHP